MGKVDKDNMCPLVSIIMPIYNASTYLMRAVDSIKQQSYTNLDVLLINDGSSDESGKLCQEVAKQDSRFRYFERANSGVAATREFGLQNSKGDYIIHFDSDDWAEATMIEDMLSVAVSSDVDVVIADFYINVHDSQTVSSQKPESLAPHSVLHELFTRLHGSCWNKLVRRSVLEKYDIHFIPGINYCEDILIWAQLLKHDDVKIAYINKPYYHYDYSTSANSITRHYTRNTYNQRVKYVERLMEILPEEEYSHNILLAKFEVKYEAYLSNVLTRSELRNLYPESNTIARELKYSLVNRLLFAMACLGLKNTALYLYRLKTNNK